MNKSLDARTSPLLDYYQPSHSIEHFEESPSSLLTSYISKRKILERAGIMMDQVKNTLAQRENDPEAFKILCKEVILIIRLGSSEDQANPNKVGGEADSQNHKKINQLISTDLMLKSNAFAIEAHQNHPNSPEGAVRRDLKTPVVSHPQWVATTIISEPSLSSETKRLGYLSLLLHDVLEDTSLSLPDWVEPQVEQLIKEMTFEGGIEEEVVELWNRSDLAKLFKLYDKIHNTLFEPAPKKPGRAKLYLEHITRLSDFVKEQYGEDLTILTLAQIVIDKLRKYTEQQKTISQDSL